MNASMAVQRGTVHKITVTQDDYELPQYTDKQLRALYDDLFASYSPLQLSSTSADPSGDTLRELQERFNIEYEIERTYKLVVDYLERALTFIAVDKTDLSKLGLVLDSEWEAIIKAALDAGDVEYGLKSLDLMMKYGTRLVENLDLRLLEHEFLLNVDKFTLFSDKLTELGYPLTPERISRLIYVYLHSRKKQSFEHVKDTQDLIHKFEAQGILPSEAGYAHVMKAYLDLSRESSLLSGANPSAAVAAVHDLFAHMRY
ncbi:hypothetical protein FRC09_015258, partial [Ceratobasidium sp. 395]